MDDKTQLDPEDDAAYVNWGPYWLMPTTEQQRELLDNCSSIWTTINGVNGRLFTGPNGKTLFLPAAGSLWGDHFDQLGLGGIYWSSTLYSNNPDIAYGLYFESNEAGWEDYRRDIGHAVRAVLSYHY